MNPRIAFWGTLELTLPYLDALVASGMTPAVVITNPDRPKGRHHELTPPPAKLWALSRGIPVLQPEKLDAVFFAELTKFDLDISIVVAYGSIMPEQIITLPSRGTLNVHYSLLPRWRGAAPTEAAILAGDRETGVSIQQMQMKLDSGPIIAEKKTIIGPDETTPELRSRLTSMGTELLIQTLPHYMEGTIIPKEQDESLATHIGKIKKEDARIDLGNGGETNYRKYRAYIEWPRSYFLANKGGKELRVLITKAHMENGAFVIDRVLPEGRKEMPYCDFMRG